jgi:hypothetical protein
VYIRFEKKISRPLRRYINRYRELKANHKTKYFVYITTKT